MKIIDLSVELFDGMISYTSHPPIVIREESTFANSGHRYQPPCEGFESRFLEMSDHSGTHIDAPIHFIREGQTVSEMDLSQCMGRAVLLDVSDFKAKDEPVSIDMLNRAEQQQHIVVESQDIVLIRTRKGQWGDATFFEEAAFAPETGQWFVDKQIKAVGLDLANIDINDNMNRDVHMKILKLPIYIVENLTNLDQLPLNKKFHFQAVPLKLKNATASPVRALAFLEE